MPTHPSALLSPRDLVLHFVERLALPGDLRDKSLLALRESEANGAEAFEAALERAAAAVVEARARGVGVAQRLAEALDQVRALGEEATQAMGRLGQGVESTFDSAAQTRTAIAAELQGIELVAAEATDLGSLRRALASGIEGVLGHLRDDTDVNRRHRDRLVADLEIARSAMADLGERVERELAQARTAESSAYVDALTGYPNRLAFHERAAIERNTARRSGAPLGVAAVGIDRLGDINSAFGHAAGDQVIRVVAKLAAEGLGADGSLFRHGAGEFAALLPGRPLPEALAALERARKAVRTFRFLARGEKVEVSLSCGVAQIDQGETAERAFERAYRALRVARDRGGNVCATERNLSADFPPA